MNRLVRFRQSAVLRAGFDERSNLVHQWRLSSIDSADRWTLHDVLADPHQERDVVSKPEFESLVTDLRRAYCVWWTRVSPRANEPTRPRIGHF